MKKISIITICYNNREGLKRTIESVCSQTFKDKEFVVVDGGSSDGTLDVLKENKDKIDIVFSEKDNGVYDALNKGIKASSGEWIICMNSGDEFADKDVLTKVFEEKIDEKVSFIYSDYWMRSKEGSLVAYQTDRKRGNVFHQSAIYKRSLHDEHGFYQVTKPYTISDLLFMLSVPENEFHKVSFKISTSDYAGLSDDLWCPRAALSLRVVYGYEKIGTAFLKYCKIVLRQKINKILKRK